MGARDRIATLRDMECVPISDPTSDALLVDRVRSGDLQALGVLYARHGADVRRLALRLAPLRGPEFADDICQAVFLTFLDTIDRYREQGQLRSWLFGITSRHCRSRQRRWWHRLGIHQRGGAGTAGVAPGQASVDVRMEARQAIAEALDALPDAQREVLVLHHLEELTIPEVAAALSISENAVSTRLYRARRAMEAAR